jgi:hypothetical protein
MVKNPSCEFRDTLIKRRAQSSRAAGDTWPLDFFRIRIYTEMERANDAVAVRLHPNLED